MRKFRFIYVLMAASFFVACAESDDLYENETNPVAKNPYEISIETAMQTLETMFPEMMRTTRVSASEVKTLRRSDLRMTTRSEDEDPQAPVAYIIPLANNGCAIMGADTRKERLYAALESTTLTPDDIARAVQQQQATRATNNINSNEEIIEIEETKNIKEFVSLILADAIIQDFGSLDSIEHTRTGIIRDTIISVQDTVFLRTKWHQNFPFNCKLDSFNPNTNMVAGCAAIAMAQILYYLQPANYTNYYSVNWELLSWLEYYLYDYADVSAENEAGEFVANIRELMGYKNPNGMTPSDTGDISCFTKTISQNATKKFGYEEYQIAQMLYANLPVYMQGSRLVSSTPPYKKYIGHAWVLDGYKSIEKYIYDDGYQTGYSKTINYVHCNYGWQGVCDGYYTLGVFDLREPLDEEMVDQMCGDVISSTEYYYDSLFYFINYYTSLQDY